MRDWSLFREKPTPQTQSLRYRLLAAILVLALLLILLRTLSFQLRSQPWDQVGLSSGESRTMQIRAPRGDILDAEGRTLACSVWQDALYLASTGLDDVALNAELLDIATVLEGEGIRPQSKLEDYFAPSRASFSAAPDGPYTYVFKKEMSRIRAWQEDENLFALAAADEGLAARYTVRETPEDFYDYLLYEKFAIERRDAGGNRRYSEREAWEIMRLRYQLLEFNWTFQRGEPVKLADQLSESLKSLFLEQNLRFRGALIKRESSRRYTEDSRYFSHVLGYVGAISAGEYASLKNFGYQLNDITGKAGVEYSAERYLHGQNGTLSYGSWQADADGEDRYLNGEALAQAKAGDQVRLSLRLEYQKVLYASLYDTIRYVRERDLGNGSSAAAVMLDLHTGRILAMGSVPSYISMDFANAAFDPMAAARSQNALSDTEHKPMQNRTISEIYAPASTFKTITATAALENQVIDQEENSYWCKGKENIGFKDWVCYSQPEHGHGYISLSEALMYSCNLYFFKLGLDTGIEAISAMARKLGLGEYTGIDLPGEAKGIRPSPEVKAATRSLASDQEWYPADTCQTAIGQFDNAYTMLQLVRAIGGIASNKLFSPHVILDIRADDGSLVRGEEIHYEDLGLADLTRKMVRDGMNQLKYYSMSNHTMSNFSVYPVEVAAKTGTAEVGLANDKINATFVCFAPSDGSEPDVAVACIVESGGKGDINSNIARDLLDVYYGFAPRPEISKLLTELEADPDRFFLLDEWFDPQAETIAAAAEQNGETPDATTESSPAQSTVSEPENEE